MPHITPTVYGASSITRHLYHTATSLVAFAESNPSFTCTLQRKISEQQLPAPQSPASFEMVRHSYHVPTSVAQAEYRLAWLCHELSVRSKDETAGAASVLTAFAEAHPLPKSAVIGIVGIAIIGPTLGIIKTRRKKKSKLTIVISDRYQNETKETVAALTTEAGNGIVSDALLELHGDATRLDPDLAAWFFEDRLLTVIFKSDSDIAVLKNELASEALPHHIDSDENGPAVVAISPVVNTGILSLSLDHP